MERMWQSQFTYFSWHAKHLKSYMSETDIALDVNISKENCQVRL